jgi:hypothetical protein
MMHYGKQAPISIVILATIVVGALMFGSLGAAMYLVGINDSAGYPGPSTTSD